MSDDTRHNCKKTKTARRTMLSAMHKMLPNQLSCVFYCTQTNWTWSAQYGCTCSVQYRVWKVAETAYFYPRNPQDPKYLGKVTKALQLRKLGEIKSAYLFKYTRAERARDESARESHCSIRPKTGIRQGENSNRRRIKNGPWTVSKDGIWLLHCIGVILVQCCNLCDTEVLKLSIFPKLNQTIYLYQKSTLKKFVQAREGILIHFPTNQMSKINEKDFDTRPKVP